jgi:hypothetical protein
MSPDLDRLNTALTDRYVVEREIGSGGMATVYLADRLVRFLRARERKTDMTTRVAVLLLAAVALLPLPGQAQEVLVVISGVDIIDPRDGTVLPDHSIVIDGDRILDVLPDGDREIPGGAVVFRADGKWVIPGLWDVHTHIQYPDEVEAFFPLLIANGVLGIRDVGGLYPPQFDSVSALQPRAPHVVAAGGGIDTRSELTRAEAGELVARRAERGADFIKVFSDLPRSTFLHVMAEADAQGLSVVGHVPIDVGVDEASDRGFRTMEHLLEILVTISPSEEQVRSDRRAALLDANLSRGEYVFELALTPLEELLATRDTVREEALYRLLARNQTWQVPTLSDIEAYSRAPDPQFWANPGLEYVPASWRVTWQIPNHRWYRVIPEDRYEETQRQIARHLGILKEMIQRMNRLGVPFLAGTDAAQWNFQVPGESLHDEIRLLNEAGLTRLEALRAATYGPAECLRLTDDFGTVMRGRKASFVVLDESPLEDMGATRGIHAVVVDGELLDRAALDSILRGAKERAAGR